MTTRREIKTETQKVPVIIREWTTCDFCGLAIKIGLYEVWEGQIVQMSGSCYPDSGSTSKYTIDFCQTCWTEKLLPWVVCHGLLPNPEESDW